MSHHEDEFIKKQRVIIKRFQQEGIIVKVGDKRKTTRQFTGILGYQKKLLELNLYNN